jgi:DNA invertase Pin-like site-specific DNA recombinase
VKAAIYARVSTLDQEPENQLAELHRYTEARGWTAVEYLDRGVSGAKESRPALDRLVTDARRRKFDVLVVWRLDRLGRNLRHLILLLELSALGVSFVSLGQGIDTGTPAGRLQLHLLAAIAQFERERIVERVRAGMARARTQGKHVGRPGRQVTDAALAAVAHLSARKAAATLGVSKSFVAKWRVSTRVAAAAPLSPCLADDFDGR